jgi:hypothetical protein
VAGTTTTLDGSASSDANGDALTYKWIMISKPLTSTAALSSDTAIKPTFVADKSGTYVLSLQVSDGKLSSNLSYVTISAGAANLAPVASAGTAQTVARGATVTLDGSASSDANGDTLIYPHTLIAYSNDSPSNFFISCC